MYLIRRYILLSLVLGGGLTASAQIGEHRNDFAVGLNGGFIMSSVGFTPDVQQTQHGGMTAGFSMKYTCEKYFNTICSIYAEVNYAKVGWKENILDKENPFEYVLQFVKVAVIKETVVFNHIINMLFNLTPF